MQSGRQFEYEVVLNSELDSNLVIPNWIGSSLSHARLLGSSAPLDTSFVLHGPLLNS
jgi:hypothetical protein